MLVSLLDRSGNALLDRFGNAVVREIDDPVLTRGAVEYFLSFENESVARADPVVARYFASDPSQCNLRIWAYDLVVGKLMPGWWLQISQPVPLVSDLADHPNLQYAINTIPLRYPTIVKNNTLLATGRFWIENSGISFHFSAYGLTRPHGLPIAAHPSASRGRKRIQLRNLSAWIGRAE